VRLLDVQDIQRRFLYEKSSRLEAVPDGVDTRQAWVYVGGLLQAPM
jgi:hypothetical protein